VKVDPVLNAAARACWLEIEIPAGTTLRYECGADQMGDWPHRYFPGSRQSATYWNSAGHLGAAWMSSGAAYAEPVSCTAR
jgi:hypothetical protein